MTDSQAKLCILHAILVMIQTHSCFSFFFLLFFKKQSFLFQIFILVMIQNKKSVQGFNWPPVKFGLKICIGWFWRTADRNMEAQVK